MADNASAIAGKRGAGLGKNKELRVERVNVMAMPPKQNLTIAGVRCLVRRVVALKR